MHAYDRVDSEIEKIVHICIKFKNLIYGLGVNHLSGINLHKAMKAMDVQHSYRNDNFMIIKYCGTFWHEMNF